MATVPIPPPHDTHAVESLEQRFRHLEAIWERETQFLSDAHRIIEHPAFQEIIALGEPVIPLMLHDLEQGPRQWVWALPRITGVNPVPPVDGGNLRKMTESWPRWGREKGHRW